MRKDMPKVIEEPGRSGIRGDVNVDRQLECRSRQALNAVLRGDEDAAEALDTRRSMRKSRTRNRTTRIWPLAKRFLVARIGQPWPQVLSEISAVLPRHQRDQWLATGGVLADVYRDAAGTLTYNSKWSGPRAVEAGTFYVDPATGLLCRMAAAPSWRKVRRAATARQRRGVDYNGERLLIDTKEGVVVAAGAMLEVLQETHGPDAVLEDRSIADLLSRGVWRSGHAGWRSGSWRNDGFLPALRARRIDGIWYWIDIGYRPGLQETREWDSLSRSFVSVMREPHLKDCHGALVPYGAGRPYEAAKRQMAARDLRMLGITNADGSEVGRAAAA